MVRNHGQQSQIAAILLFVYLAVLLWLTMMPPRYAVLERVHLVPFQTIVAEIQRGGWSMLVNIPGNIVAFMPLGLLVPLWQPHLRSFRVVFVLGLLTSISIELLQWAFTDRVVDVDDVLLNAAGAILGYLFHKWWPSP